MKRIIFIGLAAAATLLFFSACVDNSYDLDKVDTTMTILPGLTIPLNYSTDPTNIADSFFDNASPNFKDDDEGVVTIGNRNEKNLIVVEIPGSELSKLTRINMPGTIEIACGSLLADLVPGASLSVDASPVCKVCNPLNHSLQLSGKAICGGNTVSFGPYEVPAGTSKVALKEKAVVDMLNPVTSDILLTELVLDGVLPTDGSPATRADDSYVFSIQGYIPMEFEAGDEINVSIALDDISEADIQEIADNYGVSVKSFILNMDITNNAPFELSANASALSSGQQATASIDPAVAAGTVESPVTTRTAVTVTLPDGVSDLTGIKLYVKAKAKASPSEIKAEHTLTFKTIDVVFNKGIQVNL